MLDEHVAKILSGLCGLPNLEPGTFNVRIGANYLSKKEWILPKEALNGSARLFVQRCKINGIRALIVRPSSHEDNPPSTDKFHRLNTFEIMASVKLREHLNIPKGTNDKVEVEVEGDDSWWLHP